MLGITKNTPRLSNSNHPTDGYLRRNAENLISQLVSSSFLLLYTSFIQKNSLEEQERHTFLQEKPFNQQEWMPFLLLYTSFLQDQGLFFQEKQMNLEEHLPFLQIQTIFKEDRSNNGLVYCKTISNNAKNISSTFSSMPIKQRSGRII